jgi:exportin-5
LTRNSQRAPNIDSAERNARLENYVNQTLVKWSNPQFCNSLQSFEGFCSLLGLTNFQEFFFKKNASQVEDWTSVPLDEEGLALKARIDAAQQV